MTDTLHEPKSKTKPELKPTHPEPYSIQITNIRLNEANFLRWSQSVRMYIRGRGKIGYLTGEAKEPVKTDPSYSVWDAENSMVMAWLVNAMNEEISTNYMCYSTAKELWDNVSQMYSDLGNYSQIYELQQRISNTHQGEGSMTRYFNILKGLWQDLDLFNDYEWKNPDDCNHNKNIVENARIFKFLAGLNDEFDEVRGRILGRQPLPPLGEVFSEVRREECRRNVMMKKKEDEPVEKSALVVAHPTPYCATSTDLSTANISAQRSFSNQRRVEEKPRVWCDHCDKPRHTRETCWKLHGKPANWKSSKSGIRGSNYTTPRANEARANFPSAEQVDHLLQLLKSTPISGPPIGSLAQTGDIPCTYSCGLTLAPWIIDSGASDHMTSTSQFFHSYYPCPGNKKVRIADGSFSSIAGIGSIQISDKIELKSVLHVPKLACNLLSVSKLSRDSNCRAIFFDSHCEFQDQLSGRMIGSARMIDGLYYFDETLFNNKQVQGLSSSTSSMPVREQIMLWHLRLGHPSFLYLKHLFPGLFKTVDCNSLHCDTCYLSKSHRSSYQSKSYRTSKPFYLIHSDVWGPSKITTASGKKWFVTFIDDHTRLCWVYLMSTKSEVEQLFKDFYHMVENQFQTKISILRTDNGTEYFKNCLGTFLSEKGVQHQSTCRDTPQQNGIAERKNRHLLEVARALMFSMNVPKFLWGDAILTACYLINRMPTRVLKYITPLACLKESFPYCRVTSDLHLKVFGCTVFVHIPTHLRTKLDPRAEKCIFLGYAPNKRGYKCFNPTTKKIHISLDVFFLEKQPYFSHNYLQGEKEKGEDEFWQTSNPLPNVIIDIDMDIHTPLKGQEAENFSSKNYGNPSLPVQSISGSQPGGEILPDITSSELRVYTRRRNHENNRNPSFNPKQSQLSSPPQVGPSNTQGNSSTPAPFVDDYANLDLPIALRKGVRTCTTHPIAKYLSYHRLSNTHRAFTSKISHLFIPRTIQEALDHPDWKLAVQEEMNALIANDTWEVGDLPQGKKTVGCKWVFTVKFKADGSVERYKARLVAKGFTQTYGIDYHETFAPVAKMNSIRVLLSLAVHSNWPLFQLDVKNAFLNGDLEEEVFMDLPPGFEGKGGKEKVCKLKKSLYGLKQSPRAWFERFGKVIKSHGYSQGQADHTMFYRHTGGGKVAILIVYVDDIILTGDDNDEIERLKKILAKEFEIKDLGNLKYFLGMEFARSKKGIFVSQRKYVLDLLGETGLLGCKAAETPIEPNLKLEPAKTEKVINREQYQRLVGKLLYLSHTRPDIAFATSVVSQFMHSPGPDHFDAVYRILRYLKGTPGKGLLFGAHGNLQVEIYTDADWAGSITDRRSTSGYCTFVGGNLVTWRSKKQNVVARSSAEAEFRAVAHGICEALWIKRLLEELKVTSSLPMKLYCDNKAAIAIAHNPVLHDRTKHVEVDKHFIKEKIDSGVICLPYVSTTEQVADILTKGLPKKQFENLIDKLAMEDIFKPA